MVLVAVLAHGHIERVVCEPHNVDVLDSRTDYLLFDIIGTLNNTADKAADLGDLAIGTVTSID